MSCRGHRASAGSTRKKSKSHSLLYTWATGNNHRSIQEKRPRVVKPPGSCDCGQERDLGAWMHDLPPVTAKHRQAARLTRKMPSLPRRSVSQLSRILDETSLQLKFYFLTSSSCTNPNPTSFVLYNNDFSPYSFFSWAFIGKCHFEEDLGDTTELK